MGMGLARGMAFALAAAFAVGGNGFIVVEARALAAAPEEGAHGALHRTIQRAIRAEGPFFTPREQAVINAKCGYAPGEWDGHDVNINNGVFRCRNGKRVDDPEMRALLDVAQPRIQQRVRSAMAQPEVEAAIRQVSENATRRAMASIDHARIAREAARSARRAAADVERQMARASRR